MSLHGKFTNLAATRLLSGPLMDFYVGKTKRKWSLHRNLLSYHSKWFRDQIKEEVKEKGGNMELFDDDERAFELLVKWLYQGRIDDVSSMALDKKWDYASNCQQLYLLCDKINLPQLKNLAIDQFRRGCHEAGLVPGAEEMIPIYQKTMPSSPFRKLVSRIAARQIMDPANAGGANVYRECFSTSPEFAIDVINAIKEGVGGTLLDDPTEADGCEYHDHPPGQPCNLRFHK